MPTNRNCRRPASLGLLACLLWSVGGPAGCSQERGNDLASLPHKEFVVDSGLLGPAVTDSSLRLTFRPPVFFRPGNPAAVRQIQEQVRREQQAGDTLATEPVLIFGRPGAAGLCTVSRLLNPPPGGMTRTWCDTCIRKTKVTVAPATVNSDLYRIQDVAVLQFIVQNTQMVLFRVFVQGNAPEPVRVDYLLPRAEYEASVTALEASVGSMVLF